MGWSRRHPSLGIGILDVTPAAALIECSCVSILSTKRVGSNSPVAWLQALSSVPNGVSRKFRLAARVLKTCTPGQVAATLPASRSKPHDDAGAGTSGRGSASQPPSTRAGRKRDNSGCIVQGAEASGPSTSARGESEAFGAVMHLEDATGVLPVLLCGSHAQQFLGTPSLPNAFKGSESMRQVLHKMDRLAHGGHDGSGAWLDCCVQSVYADADTPSETCVWVLLETTMN